MKLLIFIVLFSIPVHALAADTEKADLVLVIKSEAKLYLMKQAKPLRVYAAAFGANPRGHKQREGDRRTPEGRYLLDYKKEDSAFYKAIHISYPNETDVRQAEALGVDPGGFVMIHGYQPDLEWLSKLRRPFNWTDGCIAVSNSAMDEIWELVEAGTPIEIRP